MSFVTGSLYTFVPFVVSIRTVLIICPPFSIEIYALACELEVNEISEGYEIHTGAFDDLGSGHVDLCIIDAYPGADISEITEKAEQIADNVLII